MLLKFPRSVQELFGCPYLEGEPISNFFIIIVIIITIIVIILIHNDESHHKTSQKLQKLSSVTLSKMSLSNFDGSFPNHQTLHCPSKWIFCTGPPSHSPTANHLQVFQSITFTPQSPPLHYFKGEARKKSNLRSPINSSLYSPGWRMWSAAGRKKVFVGFCRKHQTLSSVEFISPGLVVNSLSTK